MVQCFFKFVCLFFLFPLFYRHIHFDCSTGTLDPHLYVKWNNKWMKHTFVESHIRRVSLMKLTSFGENVNQYQITVPCPSSAMVLTFKCSHYHLVFSLVSMNRDFTLWLPLFVCFGYIILFRQCRSVMGWNVWALRAQPAFPAFIWNDVWAEE